MKSLFAAALLSLASLGGMASAATISAFEMKSNDWIVFDLAGRTDDIRVTPGTTDRSFSYSYSYSDTLCPTPWSCMPGDLATDTVYGSRGDFGYSWNPTQLNEVFETTFLNTAAAGQYLFFRVTSGTTSVARYAASVGVSPAAVPLPATGLLVLGGLGALGLMKRRRKAA